MQFGKTAIDYTKRSSVGVELPSVQLCFGMGMMVLDLKEVGTVLSQRDWLNMSVNTPDSRWAQALQDTFRTGCFTGVNPTKGAADIGLTDDERTVQTGEDSVTSAEGSVTVV